MNNKPFQFAVALMWLALPLTALRYWMVWDRLPARMASHFDANWHANGWAPKDSSFVFAIGLMAFMLLVFSIIAIAMHKSGSAGIGTWVMLVFFYLIIGFIYFINGKVIDYNLIGEPIRADVAFALIPAAVLSFTLLCLRADRGSALPSAGFISEEVHGSQFWAFLLAALGIVNLVILSQMSNASVRYPFAAVSVVLLSAAVQTWLGFHYRFTQAGLEISTLGLRLRSIPVSEIESYAVANWSPLRGYGVRGFGNFCAYVWGNRGVRIETSQGVVFLGHDEPERIVHDLDRMRQFAH